MDPLHLFPWLALLFAGLSVWSRARKGAWRGQARTWGLLAVIFAAVWLWLWRMR